MSGGHYDYAYFKIEELANAIQSDFLNDDKNTDEELSAQNDNFNYWLKQPPKEYDVLGNATPEQKEIILKEIKSLIADLNRCAIRSKKLEWFMSGDTGVNSYITNLSEL